MQINSFFHFDAYRLADEIADQKHLNRDDVIKNLCEYFGYCNDTDIAFPVWFQILLEEYDSNPMAAQIYDVLSTYIDPPIGKVYLDF